MDQPSIANPSPVEPTQNDDPSGRGISDYLLGSLVGLMLWTSLVVSLGLLRLPLFRRRQRSRGPQSSGLRILLTGRIDNRNWRLSHLLPLARAANISELLLVVDGQLTPLPKARSFMVPPAIGWLKPRAIIRSLWAVWVARRQKPDIIMAYSFFPPGLFALWAAKLTGAAIIVQVPGGIQEVESGVLLTEKAYVPRLLARRLAPLWHKLCLHFDGLVVRGGGAQAYFRRHTGLDRIEIIPGSVDPERFANRPTQREFDLAFVGSIIPRKQPFLLCQIVHHVAKRFPNLRVAVAGKGPLRPQMMHWAAEMGLKGNMHFLGHVEGVEDVLSRSRIFLLPSRVEGLSIALAEAMTAGAVPVVSDIDDLGELVVNGYSGWRVPVGDAEAFAKRICELLANQALWSRMSGCAQELAGRNNSLPVVVRRWETCLEDLTGRAISRPVLTQPAGTVSGGPVGKRPHESSVDSDKHVMLATLVGLLVWVMLQSTLVLLLIPPFRRKAPKRSLSDGAPSGLRVLITGRVDNKNWCSSHLQPLSLTANISQLLVVVSGEVPEFPKATLFPTPRPLAWLRPKAFARSIWAVLVALKEKPDVIMAYSFFPPGIFGLLAARLCGALAVLQLPGGILEIESGGWASDDIQFSGGLRRSLVALTQKLCGHFDAVIVRGRKARSYIGEHCRAPYLAVIPGSIDPKRYDFSADRRSIDVVFVGRIVATKQPDHVLHIVHRLAAMRPGLRVVMAGAGPLLGNLKRQAQQMGLAKIIRFVGHVERVEELLARSRIFLLTSRSEGLSIALAEAMTAGAVPVVADVGDLSELVLNDQTGWLIPPGDFDRYAARISALLDDPALWSKLSANARELALRHNGVETVARRWEGIFTDLLDQNSRA